MKWDTSGVHNRRRITSAEDRVCLSSIFEKFGINRGPFMGPIWNLFSSPIALPAKRKERKTVIIKFRITPREWWAHKSVFCLKTEKREFILLQPDMAKKYLVSQQPRPGKDFFRNSNRPLSISCKKVISPNGSGYDLVEDEKEAPVPLSFRSAPQTHTIICQKKYAVVMLRWRALCYFNIPKSMMYCVHTTCFMPFWCFSEDFCRPLGSCCNEETKCRRRFRDTRK